LEIFKQLDRPEISGGSPEARCKLLRPSISWLCSANERSLALALSNWVSVVDEGLGNAGAACSRVLRLQLRVDLLDGMLGIGGARAWALTGARGRARCRRRRRSSSAGAATTSANAPRADGLMHVHSLDLNLVIAPA